MMTMDSEIKILMLEDVADDAGLIERVLNKSGMSFVSQCVDGREEFTQAIREFKPDVILSDHSLLQFNSIEALRICQREGLDAPFILVTGTVSEEFAVNCLKQGADDYILKGNLSRLPSAIYNALRQREAERNKRSSEETLRIQNLELRKINEELDRFVYSASHQLRAPLRSILGLVNIAQLNLKESKKDQYELYLNLINKSVSKLDQTIDYIIDYSKNSRTDVYIERIKLQKMVEDIVDNLEYIEGSNKVKKIFNIDETTPLYTDRYRLSIVLNNILSNAIKYSDFGRDDSYVMIDIFVDSKKAVIKVEDNGIGISDQYLDTIFNMFFRATNKSEGSGLGLYIVKETMDKLNGIITVKSVINKGTTFYLEVPNNEDVGTFIENIRLDQ